MTDLTPNLANVPLTVVGDWGAMDGQENALPVLSGMRAASLADVRLLSDRQPPGVAIQGDPNRPGLPLISIYKHTGGYAWIWLTVDGPLYARLAYQFGHELGHVLSNRWGGGEPDLPKGPCQWLEEAMVEAFGLYGLHELAPAWADSPPRSYMAGYEDNIRQYLDGELLKYQQVTQQRKLGPDVSSWYRSLRTDLEVATALPGAPQPFVIPIYELFRADPSLREDLGALNRWPERSALPLVEYLTRWNQSCQELGTIGRLPDVLADQFNL
jgi:hypothetical protein